jgi:drug/metabolite transporter (DMT)-like permease
VVFASLFFGETFNVKTLGLLILALTGLVLIVNPGTRTVGWGDLVGIAAAVSGGIARACVRELGKTDSAGNIVLVFMASAVILTFAGINFMTGQSWVVEGNDVLTRGEIWFVLTGIGMSSAIALMLMTVSFRTVSTAVGSIIALSVLPVTAVVAVFVFGEPLSTGKIIGGILILTSGAGVAFVSPRVRSDIRQ